MPIKYSVSVEALKQTNCRNNFRCLSGDMEDVCEAFNTDEVEIIVTDCPKRHPNCDHCKSFDGPHQGFCTCPIRVELHQRYGI